MWRCPTDGIKRAAVAMVCGALLTLAMPPIGWWWMIWPSLACLFYLLHQPASRKRALLDSFFYGYGFCLTSLYWIAISLTVDAEQFGWLIPFAVFGLTAAIAVFWCVIGFGMWALRRHSHATKMLGFAILWGVSEGLRSVMFTGFPWNLLASVWTASAITMQPLAWMGPYVYGVFTALMVVQVMQSRWVRGVVCSAALFLAVMLPAAHRLPADAMPVMEQVNLRVVQASIPQNLKWDPQEKRAGVEKYLTLTRAAAETAPTHVIWPESAIPYILERNPELREAIGHALPEQSVLLTGVIRVEPNGKQRPKLFNALQLLDHNGALGGFYNKEHLVPFGEYVPLRGWIPLEKKITAGMQDFSAGNGQALLHVAAAPSALPLICYEIIFPSEVAARARDAAWMVNVTNDAWFGLSSGPYQHLAMAQMRAVELGIPVVRAANNGISVVIDPYGRIIKSLGMNEVGIIDTQLPRAIEGRTFYLKFFNTISSSIYR